MNSFQHIISGFFIRIGSALASIWGWCVAASMVFVNFFAGQEMAIIAVVFCVLADLFWGIWASLRQKKFAKSELVRDTLSKFVAYATAITMAVLMDKLTFDGVICTSVFTVVICVAEVWSISGNILIVNPNIAFFKLLKPALRGEIARKLNVNEDDVDAILEKMDKKDTNSKNKKP